MSSPADADAYRGVTESLATIPCSHIELISSGHPAGYAANLESAATRNDLVIAGSFLLTDAVVTAAIAKPEGRFLLIDPIVAPTPMANLVVLTVRRDQSAFLAGALAAMLTRTGVVAGVYGPGGPDDQAERIAFSRGASYVRPGITVLAAYQPADAGEPYNDPAWGAGQARTFSAQRADVIFGSGAATGVGALEGAAAAGRLCIGSELATGAASPSCLIASTRVSLDAAVADAIGRLREGWPSGNLSFGLEEGVVGLTRSSSLSSEIEQRLLAITQRLTDGTLSTGT